MNTMLEKDQALQHGIVAHIYNDKISYRRLILSVRRLILSPFVFLMSLFDWQDFHFCMEEVITYFSGRILQVTTDKFVIEKYTEDKYTRRVWRNLFRGDALKREGCLAGVFPLYRKKPDYTCWATDEGDYVEYLKLSEVNFRKPELSKAEFLALTKQDEYDFEAQEAIKYTGC